VRRLQRAGRQPALGTCQRHLHRAGGRSGVVWRLRRQWRLAESCAGRPLLPGLRTDQAGGQVQAARSGWWRASRERGPCRSRPPALERAALLLCQAAVWPLVQARRCVANRPVAAPHPGVCTRRCAAACGARELKRSGRRPRSAGLATAEHRLVAPCCARTRAARCRLCVASPALRARRRLRPPGGVGVRCAAAVAAHPRAAPGSGVCGALHRRPGRELLFPRQARLPR